MAVTASELRKDIYRILDRILTTGVPVEVIRGRRKLKIIPSEDANGRKLDRIEVRPHALKVEPEELVHVDWSRDWRP